jgi:hypothetical protein
MFFLLTSPLMGDPNVVNPAIIPWPDAGAIKMDCDQQSTLC